jgi:hypothetical protein
MRQLANGCWAVMPPSCPTSSLTSSVYPASVPETMPQPTAAGDIPAVTVPDGKSAGR